MVKSWKHGKMCICTVNIPLLDLQYIKKLMDKTIVPSRSEYIRAAIRHMINHDMELMKYKESIVEGEVELDPKLFVKVPGYNGNKPVKIIRRLETPIEEKRVYY